MEDETNTNVEDQKTTRFTKKFAAKIAAGVVAFGGICALGYGIAKSGQKTTD